MHWKLHRTERMSLQWRIDNVWKLGSNYRNGQVVASSHTSMSRPVTECEINTLTLLRLFEVQCKSTKQSWDKRSCRLTCSSELLTPITHQPYVSRTHTNFFVWITVVMRSFMAGRIASRRFSHMSIFFAIDLRNFEFATPSHDSRTMVTRDVRALYLHIEVCFCRTTATWTPCDSLVLRPKPLQTARLSYDCCATVWRTCGQDISHDVRKSDI